MRRAEAGITLIEVLISVTLLGLLTLAMLFAMRVGLSALQKADTKLMDNRRVAGAQRVLEQQIAGFMPVQAVCASDPDAGPPPTIAFFQGEPQTMRMVSSYSLQEAWRGTPRLLEFQVIPGAEGHGVRLIVNESAYTGPLGAGRTCLGVSLDPSTGLNVPHFRPIQAGPQSFVLADKLAWCRFSYLEPEKPPELERWRPDWVLPRWPLGVRIEMAPIEDNPARLRPVSVTAAIRTNRAPDINYVDY
jgi:hypothetical protein